MTGPGACGGGPLAAHSGRMAQPTPPPVPRYLRFACALALTGGLGSAAAGCYASHEAPPSGLDASARTDARLVDAPPPRDTGTDAPPVARDAPVTCAECFCDFGGGRDAGRVPSCESLGLWECCPVVGPLAPPDLPA